MDTSLEERLGQQLINRGLTISAAESCTGGLVLHRLTNVPGSSAYVLGGAVAYSNDVKRALLGVQPETLTAYGAVSAEVAGEMARGALAAFGSDIAYAITGIAGPGGGTPEKPVGTTFIAVAARGNVLTVQQHIWPGDRLAIKEQSADAALQLVLEVLSAELKAEDEV